MRRNRGIGALLFVALVAGTCAFGPPAFAAGPANDNFANAEVLVASGTVTRSNIGATLESAEPQPSCCTVAASTWFRWVAPTTGRVTFHTVGSPNDTTLAIFTGTALNALVPVASDDDGYGCDSTSFVQFNATAGTQYSVQVGVWDPSDTTANLHLTWNWFDAPKRANDDYANATTLPATSAQTVTNANNAGTTAEPGTYTSEQLGESTLWYKMTVTQPGQLSVKLAVANSLNVYGALPFMEADVYNATTQTLIGVVNNGETATLQLAAAQTIAIQVHSFVVCEGGAFTLTTSLSSGTVITSMFTQGEYDFMLQWAERLNLTPDAYAHNAVLAWIFVYTLAGIAPPAIPAPALGTVALSSVFTPAELAQLDGLAAGWQNTRGQTQRIAANALSFVLTIAGG